MVIAPGCWRFLLMPAMPATSMAELLRPCSCARLRRLLIVSTAPDVQIAVLRETEAQGPFCSLVMAVVVVKDVLVFVAFATNLEIVSAVCSLDSALGCP